MAVPETSNVVLPGDPFLYYGGSLTISCKAVYHRVTSAATQYVEAVHTVIGQVVDASCSVTVRSTTVTIAAFSAATRGDVHHTMCCQSTESRRGKLRFRSCLSLFFIMGSRSVFEENKLSYLSMPCLKCQDTGRELKLKEITAWNRVNVSQTLNYTFDRFIGKFRSNFDGGKAMFDVDPSREAQQFQARVHATPGNVSDFRHPDGCSCAGDPRHH